MSKRDKQIAVLVGAVAGIALLNKVAAREARALGVSVGALAALGWLASQVI